MDISIIGTYIKNKYMILKSTGYKPEQILPDQYVLGAVGSLPKIVLRPDGQWLNLLPEFELQNKTFETYSCTSFGVLNCLEILGKIQGFTFNLSDRFTAIIGGVDPLRFGGDPHRVSEGVRAEGAVSESFLPFDDTITSPEEYYSWKNKGNDEKTLREVGKIFTQAWAYKHTWLWNGEVNDKNERMMQSLQYSPLGISVYAWEKGSTGQYIRPTGAWDTHWTMMVGYRKDKFWIIFDSYEENSEEDIQSHMKEFGIPREVARGIKKLDWAFNIGTCKSYSLIKNEVWTAPSRGWWLWGTLSGILKLLGLKK